MRTLALMLFGLCAASLSAAHRFAILPSDDAAGAEIAQEPVLRGAWMPWLNVWEAIVPPFAEPEWVRAVVAKEDALVGVSGDGLGIWAPAGRLTPLVGALLDNEPRLVVREEGGAVRAVAFPPKPKEAPACLFFAGATTDPLPGGQDRVRQEDACFLPLWVDNLLGKPSRSPRAREAFKGASRSGRAAFARRYGREQRALARERLGLGAEATVGDLVRALRARLGEVDPPPLPETVCRLSLTNDVLTLRLANPTRRPFTVASLPEACLRGEAPNAGFEIGEPLFWPDEPPWLKESFCLAPGETREIRFRLVEEPNNHGYDTTLSIVAPVLFDGAWHALRFAERLPGRCVVDLEPVRESGGARVLTLARTVPEGWRVAPMPKGLLSVRFADCAPLDVPGRLEFATQAEGPIVLAVEEASAPQTLPATGQALLPGRTTLLPGMSVIPVVAMGPEARALASLGRPFTATFDAYALDSKGQVAYPLHASRTYAVPSEAEIRDALAARHPPRTVRSPDNPGRLWVPSSYALFKETPQLEPGWVAMRLQGETLTLTFTNRSSRDLDVFGLPAYFSRTDDVVRLGDAVLPLDVTLTRVLIPTNLPATFTLAPGESRTFRWTVRGLAPNPTQAEAALLCFCDELCLDDDLFVCRVGCPLFLTSHDAFRLIPLPIPSPTHATSQSE